MKACVSLLKICGNRYSELNASDTIPLTQVNMLLGVGSGDQTQIASLGGKQLSHLAGPISGILSFKESYKL